MIHCVRVEGGTAIYHCDFLETPRFKFEKRHGKEWFPRIGEFYGPTGLAKILTVIPKKTKLAGLKGDYEGGTANTAIGFTSDGKLWALNEGGAPFRFRLSAAGVPTSMGYDTLGGTLKESISAHPKFDQRTGETFFHGRKLMERFYMGRVADGKLVDRCEIKMPDGFHHDMFITENYVVIVDGSMRFDPAGVVKKLPLWNFKPEEKLRFGVFPRSVGKMTAEAFVWIEAPVAGEIVHTGYAFDEDGKITLFSPCGFYKEDKNHGVLGGFGPSRMKRFVIDVQQKTAEIHDVPGGEDLETEFPRIRDDRVGLRTRYGYSGWQEYDADPARGEFNFTGILKWDFQEGCLANKLHFPEGVVGGEPVFMPREGEKPGDADDRGYISMILWNEKKRESTYVVYDAQTLSPTPVVEFLVPRRVPMGFHAQWITESQFQQQLQTQ
eukprot:gnl/TRDRNA2_/TRDRNA2_169039_c1_seq1.p1 gnl/TRDRNA2_/TRDRNA2_169039_c1~~gnl/TRDRNA2_/TRDRNA2_169039_c1_seq1.p1  ORF type:complete len:498 (-),score=103.76 gnl/TRDRNA2_/TRDRNA2_169039_c1_seq1:146-1459(-)